VEIVMAHYTDYLAFALSLKPLQKRQAGSRMDIGLQGSLFG
jgi:hypothetical protein